MQENFGGGSSRSSSSPTALVRRLALVPPRLDLHVALRRLYDGHDLVLARLGHVLAVDGSDLVAPHEAALDLGDPSRHLQAVSVLVTVFFLQSFCFNPSWVDQLTMSDTKTPLPFLLPTRLIPRPFPGFLLNSTSNSSKSSAAPWSSVAGLTIMMA